MKLLQIKDGNDFSARALPLAEYDEDLVLAEGSLIRNAMNPWGKAMAEFINEQNLVDAEMLFEFSKDWPWPYTSIEEVEEDLYHNNNMVDAFLEVDEMQRLIEQAGFHIYQFSGYSKGDHYAIVTSIPVSEEYLEELEAIVFGGNWYAFSVVEAHEIANLEVVLNEELYSSGSVFLHIPIGSSAIAIFTTILMDALTELGVFEGNVDGVIVPNTGNTLDDEISEFILSNTDLQFYINLED